MASPHLPPIDDDEEEEEEEELIANELPNIQVLPTEVEENWPRLIPRIFDGRAMRNMGVFGKIQEAFVKRRPFQSRFVIELYYDTDLKNQLLQAWNILETFQLKLTKPSPHITLACTTFSHRSKLEKILDNLALNQKIIPLTFSSIGLFINARSPPQENPLIQFHLKLCEAMTEKRIEIGENYRPGTWVPFCVVAEKVPMNRKRQVLLALQRLNLPFTGYGVEIRLVEITPTLEVYSFEKEGATFLFSKLVNLADEILRRFSVPKEIAENELYFPRLADGESVDIEVWEPGKRVWSMVIKRYMDYTYHIEADWKVDLVQMKLVAGDVISLYKLRRPNVFIFPYQYMIMVEKAKKSDDSKDNSAAGDQDDRAAEVEDTSVANDEDKSAVEVEDNN